MDEIHNVPYATSSVELCCECRREPSVKGKSLCRTCIRELRADD